MPTSFIADYARCNARLPERTQVF